VVLSIRISPVLTPNPGSLDQISAAVCFAGMVLVHSLRGFLSLFLIAGFCHGTAPESGDSVAEAYSSKTQTTSQESPQAVSISSPGSSSTCSTFNDPSSYGMGLLLKAVEINSESPRNVENNGAFQGIGAPGSHEGEFPPTEPSPQPQDARITQNSSLTPAPPNTISISPDQRNLSHLQPHAVSEPTGTSGGTQPPDPHSTFFEHLILERDIFPLILNIPTTEIAEIMASDHSIASNVRETRGLATNTILDGGQISAAMEPHSEYIDTGRFFKRMPSPSITSATENALSSAELYSFDTQSMLGNNVPNLEELTAEEYLERSRMSLSLSIFKNAFSVHDGDNPYLGVRLSSSDIFTKWMSLGSKIQKADFSDDEISVPRIMRVYRVVGISGIVYEMDLGPGILPSRLTSLSFHLFLMYFVGETQFARTTVIETCIAFLALLERLSANGVGMSGKYNPGESIYVDPLTGRLALLNLMMLESVQKIDTSFAIKWVTDLLRATAILSLEDVLAVPPGCSYVSMIYALSLIHDGEYSWFKKYFDSRNAHNSGEQSCHDSQQFIHPNFRPEKSGQDGIIYSNHINSEE
jgi:hypothetical protein